MLLMLEINCKQTVPNIRGLAVLSVTMLQRCKQNSARRATDVIRRHIGGTQQIGNRSA